jgi:hypothetical protein
LRPPHRFRPLQVHLTLDSAVRICSALHNRQPVACLVHQPPSLQLEVCLALRRDNLQVAVFLVRIHLRLNLVVYLAMHNPLPAAVCSATRLSK